MSNPKLKQPEVKGIYHIYSMALDAVALEMNTLVVLKGIAVGIALLVISLVSLWLLDPALENFVAKRIDVTKKGNYLAVDQYADGTVKEPTDIILSVVIPAYNEEKRISIMLDEAIGFLEGWSANTKKKYEVIVVDDGSKDKTADVAMQYFKKYPKTLRYLKLIKNQGKGGAVKLGVAKALGNYILFADADGATDFKDIAKLLFEIPRVEKFDPKFNDDMAIGKSKLFTRISCHQSPSLVAGSRAHLEDKSIASREWYRTILMRGFHFYVQVMVTHNVRDTQCGFKLFTSKAAKILFSNLHLFRWAFDIELVYLAEKLNIPIAEVG